MQSSSSFTATSVTGKLKFGATAERFRLCRSGSDTVARTCSRHIGGFSLIEVLAAFVVLALVGTALFRLFAGALGNVGLADEYSRAALYAESKLAALGSEAPLREGADQGTSEDNHFSWTSRVELYKPPDAKPDLDPALDTSPLRLWRLVVEVHWPGSSGNDRSIALATVRAATRELGQ